MSHVQQQLFGHTIGSGPAVAGPAASPLRVAGSAPASISVAAAAEAPSIQKRLGLDLGDKRGLLPDIAGVAVLVTALGSYGGFW
ncbi:MAG TPA: hypothetical protein VHL98_12180 [Microvirga sp.]|nr:hypothetical protein [Microvirga sp.]